MRRLSFIAVLTLVLFIGLGVSYSDSLSSFSGTWVDNDNLTFKIVVDDNTITVQCVEEPVLIDKYQYDGTTLHFRVGTVFNYSLRLKDENTLVGWHQLEGFAAKDTTWQRVQEQSIVEEGLKNWQPIVTAVRMMEICIRDHECEDGDILSVYVNGAHVMKEELFNTYSCERVRVVSGINYIKVVAVNGTGYKGNCDHSDCNTGEIRVSAITSDGRTSQSQRQSWKLRSSSGSSSTIQVSIRP